MNPGGPFLLNTPMASCSAPTHFIYATHLIRARRESLRCTHNISAQAPRPEDDALVQVSQQAPWWIVSMSVPTTPMTVYPVCTYTLYIGYPHSQPPFTSSIFSYDILHSSLHQPNALQTGPRFKQLSNLFMCYTKHLRQDSRGMNRCILGAFLHAISNFQDNMFLNSVFWVVP